MRWRETVGGVGTISSESVVGSFVRTGNTLRITIRGEPETAAYTATLSDGIGRITLVDDGATFQFQRIAGTAPSTDEN